MMTMHRKEAPAFLKSNWKTWTRAYIKSGKFSYHNKRGEIIEILRQSTLSHCAFCDDLLFPFVGEMGEIEHFRPKNKFKCSAYVWGNLYPICRRCNNKKLARFDYSLLKPDAKGYEFSDWFRLDLNTFELKPCLSDKSDRKRATITIKLYNLNGKDKIKRRKFEFYKIKKGDYDNSDIQPFRFIKRK